MKKLYAVAAIASAAIATPSFAAVSFAFDAANSFVKISSNPTNCILLGTCPLSATLATPFTSFDLDVGQSHTFDFAQLVVGPGLGTGSAVLDAQLAFFTPSASPASTGGTASYFRLGGRFTPGVLGGSLTWNTPLQQLTAANGTKFSVAFSNVSGAQFGGTVRAPVTITLDSVAAVPEPATWAMMIGGFGMIGGAMRYRRRKAQVSFTAA